MGCRNCMMSPNLLPALIHLAWLIAFYGLLLCWQFTKDERAKNLVGGAQAFIVHALLFLTVWVVRFWFYGVNVPTLIMSLWGIFIWMHALLTMIFPMVFSIRGGR